MVWWIIATVCAYTVKGIAGFASTLVFSTILAFSNNNINITPIDLFVSFPTNVYMTWKERKFIRFDICGPIIIFILIGIIPGMMLLKYVDPGAVKIIFGLVIILLSIEMLVQDLLNKNSRPSTAFKVVIGIMSGLLCGMFGISALMSIYVGRMTDDSREFRSNACLIFIVDSIIRGIMYFATGIITLTAIKRAAVLIPIMALSLAFGISLRKHIDDKKIRKIIIGLLMLSGIALLVNNI